MSSGKEARESPLKARRHWLARWISSVRAAALLFEAGIVPAPGSRIIWISSPRPCGLGPLLAAVARGPEDEAAILGKR